MAQYIDKDTLVAEIEKLKGKVSDSSSYCNGWQHALRMLEIELNTLEVKEVDLEKELDEWIKYGPHTNYPWCTIPDAIKITAEYFFELGLKARKENKL